MASYFRQVPNFEYVSRNKGEQYISNYTQVKNLFKKGKLREDIFQDLAFFEKYSIIGDERPDNVAFKFYNDETLDWVILLSNNILNIQSEWPLPQRNFDTFLLEKYDDYNALYNGIHHYETREIKNSQGITLVPARLQVDSSYSFIYYDSLTGQQVETGNISIPVTNYEYEVELNENKRNIFTLKPRYLNIVFNDLEEIMTYKKGATQYVSDTLKKGDNIRLYS
jgi:hypothetical protein